MRDYIDIITRARADSSPVAQEAAEALEELHQLARRMTALGVDLESQIQDDLTPDYYAILGSDNPMTMMITPEVLREMNLPYQLPLKFTALKVIGESWIVKFSDDDEPQEFYTHDAYNQAVADHEKKQEK